MKKTATALGLAIALASGSAAAQGFDQRNLYVGGGLSFNSLSGFDDAVGFQIFAGYLFTPVGVGQISLAAEAGWMTSGDFSAPGQPDVSADGLWVNGVVGYPMTARFQFLGRAGMDFGDDDGLMFGIGLGYGLTSELELRAEYVVRDNINSTQVNVAYHF
jgi:hypothetical protein